MTTAQREQLAGLIARERAGVADRVPERAGHLVYLDSDVPRDGDTSVPPGGHAARISLAHEHGDGWRVPIGVTRAEALLLDGLPTEQQAWIGERFAPHLLRTWTEPMAR